MSDVRVVLREKCWNCDALITRQEMLTDYDGLLGSDSVAVVQIVWCRYCSAENPRPRQAATS